MIEIRYSGICENCKYADLEMRGVDIGIDMKQWIVKCRHEAACNAFKMRMEDRTRKREGVQP